MGASGNWGEGIEFGRAQCALSPPSAGRAGALSPAVQLPALRRRLGLPAVLRMVKAPARECSGLILLSGCHRATEELQRFFTSARRRGQYPCTGGAAGGAGVGMWQPGQEGHEKHPDTVPGTGGHRGLYPAPAPAQDGYMAGVLLVVQDHAQHVAQDGGAKLPGHCRAGRHGWIGVDLQQPGLAILPEHKVGSIELEATLAGPHQLLRALQGNHHHLRRAGDDHLLPGLCMPCSLQAQLELLAGPDQVARQFGVPVPSQPPPLLDGDIAEVPGTGVGRAGTGQRGAKVPGVWRWGGGHSLVQAVQVEGPGAEAHVAVAIKPDGEQVPAGQQKPLL
ncbi:uncharacterized protein LOC115619916 isoform X1 [Strigops habroptila]|uniref:uncharacterized protein LOC115619916 isoform X1 n=1 Tax=Strigops habroptila TaxID=2489341 RepID=UPI0011CF7EBF|nr:uncharacterized protein LOC115619916 isoform X1 [Strigops habroptila]